MNKRITSRIILSFIIAVALILSSCPLPITDTLVAALEDDLKPVITFDSHPDDGGPYYYYSSTTIEGTISDDAIASGDERGRLSKLTVKVDGESSQYTGGIILDSTGDVSIDPDSGPIVIDYPGDQTFSFTFDSSGLNSDITLEITAVDLNGNVREALLDLDSSGGPRVVIDTPTDDFSYGDSTEISLSGTIYDSVHLVDTIDEIAKVSFYIAQTIDIEMELDGASTTYITNIDKFGAEFRLDGNDFTCDFYPSDSMLGDDHDLKITVEDRNGLEWSDSVTIQYSDGAPSIDISSPDRITKYYHNSKPGYTDPPINLNFTVTSSGNEVFYVAYQIQEGTNDYGAEVPLSPIDGTPFTYSGEKAFSTQITLDGREGNVRIRVVAKDLLGNVSDPATRTIYDDIVGPEYQSFRWESGGSAVSYANGEDIVSMSFSLYDALSGEDHESLTISRTDSDSSYNTTLDEQDDTEGPYDLVFDFTDGHMSSHEGAIPFTLSAFDVIGNPSSITETDETLIYYHDAPDQGDITVSLENRTDTDDNEYLREGETLRITLPSDRHLDFGAFDFDIDFDGNISNVVFDEGIYYEDILITSSTTEGPVNWEWGYVDMAGNIGAYTSPSSTYTVDRTGPYLAISDIYGEADGGNQALKNGLVTLTATCADVRSGIDGDPEVKFYVVTDSGTVEVDPDDFDFDSDTGDLIARLYIDGLSPQGTITGKISMSDGAGNPVNLTAAGSVLVDSQDPVVTINDYFVGSTGNLKAGGGDTVTLEFSINESAKFDKDPVVIFVDSTTDPDDYYLATRITVVGGTDRKGWTAEYDVPSSGSLTDTTFRAEVEVWDQVNYSDTDDDNSVSIDNEPPGLTLDTNGFYADSTGDLIAGIGEVITLKFNTNEALDGSAPSPVVKFFNDGLMATVTATSGNYEDWTAVYTVVEQNPPTEPIRTGAVTAEIDAWDDYGNLSEINASGITMDNQSPVAGDGESSGTIKQSTVILSVDVTDNVAIESVEIEGQAATLDSGSTYELSGFDLPNAATFEINVEVWDTAGNSDTSANSITLTD